MMCHKSFLMASSWWCPKNVCQLTPWPWNSIVLIHFLLIRPPLYKKQLADYWKLLSLNYWGVWNSINDLNLAQRQENLFKIFIKFDSNYILAGNINLLTNSWLQWYFHLGMWIDFARRWMKLDISDMGVIVGRPACVSVQSSLKRHKLIALLLASLAKTSDCTAHCIGSVLMSLHVNFAHPTLALTIRHGK